MNKLFLYRLMLITGQLLLLVANVIWPMWPQVGWSLWLICGVYLLLVLVVQSWQPQVHLNRAMIGVDLLLWGLYFYHLQGVSNPLIWCLLIPAVLSALSQGVRFTWLVTALANSLYLLLWWVSGDSELHRGHGEVMQQHVTGMWLGFIAVSMLLTWVTTQLMQRIRQKNAAIIAYEKQRQADENLIKMATLATSLAHELGTPLTSIKLLVNELQLAVADPTQRQDLDMLDSQVMRCKQVLEDLTAVTEQSQAEPGEAMSVTGFVKTLIRGLNAEDVAIHVAAEEAGDGLIYVDTLLRLACVNLLNNSISAGAKHINIKLEAQVSVVLIKLVDDGAGRSHHNAQGLGIGLKLSQRILESSGGGLELKVNQQGAEAVVSIPWFEQEPRS